MPPRVSVVIKSYNHAAFIAQAIRSVLDQSFQDFEIVVTDDASNDGTADVIRSFADPRIALMVHEQNRGISHAMNATIARARGELIAILNSDDYALPGRLERQVAFLDARPEVTAVFGMPRLVDESGAATAGFFDFRQALALPDFSRGAWLRQFFFRGNVLCAPTAMIRRAAYERVGRYDARLANMQDLDMWVRLAPDHDIHVLPEELTAFRVRDNLQNASAPRSDTMLRSQFEYAQILKHYRSMDPRVLRGAFAADLATHGLDADAPPHLWLAELALVVGGPAHHLFALTALFETARSDTAAERLRALSGSVDLFGVLRAHADDAHISGMRDHILHLDRHVAELQEVIAALRTAILLRERDATGLQETNAELHAKVLQQDREVAELQEVIATLRAAILLRDRDSAGLQETNAELHAKLLQQDRQVAELQEVIAALRHTIDGLEDTSARLAGSRSWRYTAPMRWLWGRASRLRSRRRSRSPDRD